MNERPSQALALDRAPVEPLRFFSQKPEIQKNSEIEYKKILIGTGLILVGSALILDGSINNNNIETLAGGVMFGVGLYTVLKKSS